MPSSAHLLIHLNKFLSVPARAILSAKATLHFNIVSQILSKQIIYKCPINQVKACIGMYANTFYGNDKHLEDKQVHSVHT